MKPATDHGPRTTDKAIHPTSFALAVLAVAEDLERVAGTLRYSLRGAMAFAVQRGIEDAVERLDHQSKALRNISAKMPGSRGPADDYPPVDPDADGPSWDDPVGGR